MKTSTRIGAWVLVLTWVMIFLSPLMFINFSHEFSTKRFLVELCIPMSLFITFTANFFWLTPHVLMKGRPWRFWLINMTMFVVIALLIHDWLVFSSHTWFPELLTEPQWNGQRRELWQGFYICRDIFNMAVSGVVATTLVLSRSWGEAKQRQADMEQERMEMEIKMLRYQINPHFMLNTLNNIYALTAFDKEQAQDMIVKFSNLLRYILYEAARETVDLKDETDFIHTYVQLMRIRIPANVDVQEHIDIGQAPQVQISPLLFLSLVENAFKHGTTTNAPSFVNICIKADNEHIVCDIQNSNHPKNDDDHSGHGIGLQQVQRRLDLQYPGHYEWTYGPSDDRKTYYSKIILYDTKLHHHR